ncbi:Pentatricopeptide repeat-containing protein [Drosera capensis]
MATSHTLTLLSTHPHLNSHPKFPQLRPHFTLSQNPTKTLHRFHPISSFSHPIASTSFSEELPTEIPKFRWGKIDQRTMTEEQRLAVSRLPKKMTKRCKAFMRQMICYDSGKGRLGDVVSAWDQIMKPRRAEWLVALKELGRMGHPNALEVAVHALDHQSFEPNVRDYTKIINAYTKQDRLNDAENTLQTMEKRGIACDQALLTSMIHMYKKASSFQQAEATFDKLRCLGQPLDVMSYGSMIMAYIRSGNPEKGENLLGEMDELEIRAGREIYKALLREYSMRGDTLGAQRIFKMIQLAGTRPDVKFCALLINAYVVAGQSGRARVAFDNMRSSGVEPNDKCVALLLTAYEKENELNLALNLLLELEKDGILVGAEASEILAGWFRRLGVVEEVALVLTEFAEGTQVQQSQ